MDALLAEFGSETVYRVGYQALGYPPPLIDTQGQVTFVRNAIEKELKESKERSIR